MGKPLRCRFLCITALLTLLFTAGGGIVPSFSQILISAGDQVQVEFTTQSNSSDESGILSLSITDLQSIISPHFSDGDHLIPINSESLSEPAFFTVNDETKAVLGSISGMGEPEPIFFAGSLRNSGSESIGEVFIAFDFLYNRQIKPQNLSIQLQFRVNDRAWKDVPGGMVTSENISAEEGGEGWGSVSTQIQLSDLYLREGDELHLMWKQIGSESDSYEETFGLQRFEISAEAADSDQLEDGDLIITEIFPRTEVSGTLFEYLELFNPNPHAASLKGVEIGTDLGGIVIQQDISIPAYGVAVLSNLDISDLPSVKNSYFYDGSMLKPVSGRVEIKQAGHLIASAAYDRARPEIALELESAESAYDGYSSLLDFTESEISFFENLTGSPGRLGRTRPLFTNSVNPGSTTLAVLPGEPAARQGSLSGLHFFTENGLESDLQNLEPFTPVFVENESSAPVEIGVTDANSLMADPFSVYPLNTGSAIITSVYQPGLGERFGGAWAQTVDRVSPLSLYWSNIHNRFQFRFAGDGSLSVWSPVIVNRSAAENALLKANPGNNGQPALTRYIGLSVKHVEEEGARLLDEAILGFIAESSGDDEPRYDILKMHAEIPDGEDRALLNHQLFFMSALSSNAADAFTHLPYRIEEEQVVPLGFESNAENPVNLKLEWLLSEDVPDEWILILEDRITGNRVDMKEVNSMEFRFNPTERNAENRMAKRDGPRLLALVPEQAPRFRIIIQPFQTFQESVEEDELPDSIELRPNYPNPFNPSTNINFFLPDERSVRLGVFNIVGQQVATLIDDVVPAGEHTVVWNASDRPSGIYIVQLETGNRIFSRKITLIK